MGSSSALKEKEVLALTTAWMNRENIRLNESQTQNNKCCMKSVSIGPQEAGIAVTFHQLVDVFLGKEGGGETQKKELSVRAKGNDNLADPAVERNKRNLGMFEWRKENLPRVLAPQQCT